MPKVAYNKWTWQLWSLPQSGRKRNLPPAALRRLVRMVKSLEKTLKSKSAMNQKLLKVQVTSVFRINISLEVAVQDRSPCSRLGTGNSAVR